MCQHGDYFRSAARAAAISRNTELNMAVTTQRRKLNKVLASGLCQPKIARDEHCREAIVSHLRGVQKAIPISVQFG
jgi:hypothetical protein